MKCAAGPLVEGTEPFRVISILCIAIFDDAARGTDGLAARLTSALGNPSRQSEAIMASSFIYASWRVGRNRISFTSTSSGWLIANATIRANESAGIATAS